MGVICVCVCVCYLCVCVIPLCICVHVCYLCLCVYVCVCVCAGVGVGVTSVYTCVCMLGLMHFMSPAVAGSTCMALFCDLFRIIPSLPAYHKEQEAEGSTSVEVESR